MKWCIFVNRRCYGEDCMGWFRENCFVYQLLPEIPVDVHLQTEMDWSHESRKEEDSSPEGSDDQLTFLDELERLIAQKRA